jgi:hypothetical protein
VNSRKFQLLSQLEKTTNLLPGTIKGKDIPAELHKTNDSKYDAAKRKFHSGFNRNKIFKVMSYISFVLQGEGLIHSEEMKDLWVSDVTCHTPLRLVSFYIVHLLSGHNSLFNHNH